MDSANCTISLLLEGFTSSELVDRVIAIEIFLSWIRTLRLQLKTDGLVPCSGSSKESAHMVLSSTHDLITPFTFCSRYTVSGKVQLIASGRQHKEQTPRTRV